MLTRRLRFDRNGEPAEVVRLEEIELGIPGPGEMIVRMEASAMHIADIKLVQGIDALRRPLPATPGFEGVGEVVETGPDCGYEAGERVFLPLGCGTFSEHVRVRSGDMGMRSAPSGDAEQLVLSNINGATAWTLLQDFVDLKQGEWVLQDAANSNVGRYLIALAAKWGYRTVNLVRREEVVQELKDLGADAVVLDGPGLPARIREATGGADIRLGIDAIAGEGVMRMADCLADGGLIVNYGALTDQPCQIDFWQMFLRDIRLCGMSTTRCFAARSREEIEKLQNEIARMASDGRLSAKIAARYRLDQWREAFAHAARTGSARDGKIIVLPNG
ncbi:MAG: zinc-dependent alcohol dehydrogenase family protein [Gammaproteobacteria bacterium]|nr:zinc-dependent alcohol dehydrogenase family protein [Gammaproteobacteria bacterium]